MYLPWCSIKYSSDLLEERLRCSRTPNRLNVYLLPLRDVVVYPQMVIPLFVGREKSIQALEAAMEADKRVLLSGSARSCPG